MGNASQRRERRLAGDLRQALAEDPVQFDRIWGRYLEGWCREVQVRGRALQRGTASAIKAAVFPVLEKAQRRLAMIGAEADVRVGSQTRLVLTHECCKAFAEVSDARLYPLARSAGRGV